MVQRQTSLRAKLAAYSFGLLHPKCPQVTLPVEPEFWQCSSLSSLAPDSETTHVQPLLPDQEPGRDAACVDDMAKEDEDFEDVVGNLEPMAGIYPDHAG